MFLTSVFVPSVVRPFRPYRDVGVAAQAALFHVAVVHPERDEDLTKLPERLGGVPSRAQIRLGDDLDQRRAAAIEIEAGLLVGVRKPLVERLARIFLQVHARDADRPGGAASAKFERAGRRQRQLVLRDLIPLGQIRVEVVFSGKNRLFVDRAVQCQGRLGGEIHGPPVQDRQSPGKPETDRADARVRGVPESRAAAAKNLRVREEPGVYFEPNDGFKSHEV